MIAFVAPTVIGCVQLGATVDYAILMTTRFQEELQRRDRKEAIQIAAASSDVSILTSALVFFCSTWALHCLYHGHRQQHLPDAGPGAPSSPP